ncbi:glycosyltransferase [Micromonospora costi]|uniref:glycosyltransferase n=1 Tax=Micromonospora costi TaxID=1530042 RepID=UPI0033D26D30
MGGLRVAVYPHAMHIGGSQLNAVELAGALAERGHEVVVVGEPGPLVQRVLAMGLEHVPVAADRHRPSPVVAARLRQLSRRRGLDVLHGYEWPPALEAAAASAAPGTPAVAVCTVMSMAVAPFLPASMPLVVGTEAIRAHTASRRPGPVWLIEPPVDVTANAPGHPVGDFPARYGLDDTDPDAVTIVVVTRLAAELKLEGVLSAIDAVGLLADLPVRLVVTGDGPARATVQQRAEAVNARVGRRAVVLTGELFDPRPAYASADIMLGMGGSALRALAFGRPLVVQGERGFWRLLTPESCPLFLEQGWYGLGDGGDGAGLLAGILRPLMTDRARRAELGAYGRRLAVERFSLQRAAALQEQIYLAAIEQRRSAGAQRVRAVREGLRSAGGLARHEVRERVQRLRGRAARDDFNAATLAEKSLAGAPRDRA